MREREREGERGRERKSLTENPSIYKYNFIFDSFL
jgi:hypothetical protein